VAHCIVPLDILWYAWYLGYAHYVSHKEKKGGEWMDKGRIIRLERFPEDLYRRLKVYAAMNDLTMKEIIIKSVDEYLKKVGG